MRQLLTHSRMATFRACPRRHWIRYERGLVPEEESSVLRVGAAFHHIMETRPDNILAEVMLLVAGEYEAYLTTAMITAHDARWQDHPLEVVCAEQEFCLPLVNPETGYPSTVWFLAGKIDAIVRLPDGRLALLELKTTSRDISAGSEYWTQLQLDYQLSIYVNAARALGYDVETVLYDVVKRPGLKPLLATPPESRKYRKDGGLYAGQRLEDESPFDYGFRVMQWMHDHLSEVCVRHEIARLDDDLEQCHWELWQQQLTMRTMQRAGERAHYRNPGSCYNPYPCPYLAICQNRDLAERVPDGFRVVEQVHTELTLTAA